MSIVHIRKALKAFVEIEIEHKDLEELMLLAERCMRTVMSKWTCIKFYIKCSALFKVRMFKYKNFKTSNMSISER